MTKEERIWWAVLCLADEDGERAARRGDDDVLAPHKVSGIVRCKLRDEFKANLDDVFDEARSIYTALRQQEKDKRIKEKKMWEEASELIDDLRSRYLSGIKDETKK